MKTTNILKSHFKPTVCDAQKRFLGGKSFQDMSTNTIIIEHTTMIILIQHIEHILSSINNEAVMFVVNLT